MVNRGKTGSLLTKGTVYQNSSEFTRIYQNSPEFTTTSQNWSKCFVTAGNYWRSGAVRSVKCSLIRSYLKARDDYFPCTSKSFYDCFPSSLCFVRALEHNQYKNGATQLKSSTFEIVAYFPLRVGDRKKAEIVDPKFSTDLRRSCIDCALVFSLFNIYQNIPRFTTVYHGLPRFITVYHGLPRFTTVYYGLPRFIFCRS